MSRPTPLFIDGRPVKTERHAVIRSPYDGHEVAEVALGSPADLEAATVAAVRAFDATRRLSRRQRADILLRVAEGVARRKDAIAETMTDEMGKPLQFSRMEVDRCVTTFTLAAEEARRWAGEVVPVDIEPHTAGFHAQTVMVPLGPVAAISPFNFPLNLVAHKLAPCLAVGSSMVLKPARQTPLEALALAEIVHEAGAPPGAFNVVNCEPAVGEALASDDRFPFLTFTGSASVGWALKQKAWRKRMTLELGGNAACIVHGDADLDHAAQKCASGGFALSGQSCISVQRILVHDEVYADFEKKLLERVRALKVGDPRDPATIVGPVIDSSAAERILAWIAEAKAGGARVLCGGGRQGNVIEPTVVADAAPDLKVSCQEVFGPVVTLSRYQDFEQAVRQADASPFGLQAGLFTHDLRLIRHAVENLDVGGLVVNDAPTTRIDNMPYGGRRASGLGREGPRYAMHEMSEPRLVLFNLDH
ncbi:MAG TPA: aldehyde dehydrogenase family protein [Candidatus Cryosericum sp.]|nr:aldehyde dehydrogenase family protein [Candidatus Cryosericum sp.]